MIRARLLAIEADHDSRRSTSRLILDRLVPPAKDTVCSINAIRHNPRCKLSDAGISRTMERRFVFKGLIS